MRVVIAMVLVVVVASVASAEPGKISMSVKRHAALAAETADQARVSSQAPVKQPTSAWKKVAAGVVGGVAGFFAGGYIGAAIDGECGGCDDPGLKGALIGAPIGAAVGATLGVVLASK